MKMAPWLSTLETRWGELSLAYLLKFATTLNEVLPAHVLRFWTSGLFKSTQHRVSRPRDLKETSSRFSIAYHCQPDEDSILEPLPLKGQKGQDEARLQFKRWWEGRGSQKGFRVLREEITWERGWKPPAVETVALMYVVIYSDCLESNCSELRKL